MGAGMTPFEHEPSYFASMLYISGKGSGFIQRDEFTPEDTGFFAYADGVLDRTPDVSAYVTKLAALVEDGGYLLLSSSPLRATAIDAMMETLDSGLYRRTVSRMQINGMYFYLLERSLVEGRVFFAFKRAAKDAESVPISSIPSMLKGLPEAIVFRNGGGIGDVIHAAAVAEEYSRQGFDTLLMSMEKVRHVYAANPWIKRSVPIPGFDDAVLFRFMEFWSRRVRLFVNLDWSIEGFLLKKSFVSEYFWSDAQRRAMCGKCYARNIADLAGLGEQYRIRSYASPAEQLEAQTVVEQLNGGRNG